MSESKTPRTEAVEERSTFVSNEMQYPVDIKDGGIVDPSGRKITVFLPGVVKYMNDFNFYRLRCNALELELSSAFRRGQEWIPVSERLPEVAEVVAVLLSDKGPWAAWYDGEKWSANDDDVHVTHWMPLPAAPVLDSGEGK